VIKIRDSGPLGRLTTLISRRMAFRRDTPTDPKASPVYWWARDIESREVAPVQIWRSTSPAYNDTVVVFGDAEAYDIRFYQLLEPIAPPSGA
jgi:hypothetical protein